MQKVEREKGGDLVPSYQNYVRRGYHSSIVWDDKVIVHGGYITSKNPSLSANKIYFYPSRGTISIPLNQKWNTTTLQLDTIDDQRQRAMDPALFVSQNPSKAHMFTNSRCTECPPNGSFRDLEADTDGDLHWDDGFGGYLNLTLSPYASLNNVGYSPAFSEVPGEPSEYLASIDWNKDGGTLDPIALHDDLAEIIPKTRWMHALPSFGDHGIILFFKKEQLNNITIYDPTQNTWYRQETTGAIREFQGGACITGAQSSSGSYEIIFYGGRYQEAAGPTISSDVFVLTVPGFRWFRHNPRGSEPRMGHSCEALGNKLALSIGGFQAFPRGEEPGTVPNNAWKDPDPWYQGLKVFDMTELEWSDDYDPDAGPYESPAFVRDWYTQNASVVWSSPDVHALFPGNLSQYGTEAPGASGASQHNLTKSDSGGNNDAVVVAATVPTILILLSIVAGWLFWRHRQRRKQEEKLESDAGSNQQEQPESDPGLGKPELPATSALEAFKTADAESDARSFMEMDNEGNRQEMSTEYGFNEMGHGEHRMELEVVEDPVELDVDNVGGRPPNHQAFVPVYELPTSQMDRKSSKSSKSG